jgi:starch-binding outer membrane protein, SusD/RagB family
MKKLFYIFALAALVYTTPSCNKKLDVQPQNSVTPDQIQTSADVQALIGGAYSQLQSYGAFGEQFQLVTDLIADSDQVNWVGTYSQYKDIQRKQVIANNYVAGTLWGNSYKVIDIANTVIDKLSIVDSADKDNYHGQALFLRGIMYYELVGIFSKPYSDGGASTNLGVPILVEPVYSYDSLKDKPSRAPVAQVYAQIVADLTDAIALQKPLGTSDVYKSEAFLARVYLSMGDYTNAAIMADDVITNGGYQLNSSYDKAFNNASASLEDIFYIDQTSQSNSGTSNQGIVTFYAANYGQPAGLPSGRGDAQIDPNYYNYFEANDFRASFVTVGGSIAGFNGDYPDKWALFYKVIPVVRLAEMYLTRGEATLMSGGSLGDPVADINAVRTRSGASALSSVTQQDFVDERFREMGFEGDRMWTLKRLKMMFDGGRTFDDDMLIMPIPQTEIDVNKNIVQNNGY